MNKSPSSLIFVNPTPRLLPALVAITLISGAFLLLVAALATGTDLVGW